MSTSMWSLSALFPPPPWYPTGPRPLQPHSYDEEGALPQICVQTEGDRAGTGVGSWVNDQAICFRARGRRGGG